MVKKSLSLVFVGLIFISSTNVTVCKAGDDYEKLNASLVNYTAEEQLNLFWDKIKETNYQASSDGTRGFWDWFSGKTSTGLPTKERAALSALAALRNEKDVASIFNPKMGPFPPQGFQKPTHFLGVVAQCRFEAANTKYTGLFSSGSTGLARLSLIGHGRGPVGPSLSLMNLVDHLQPINFNAMHSVDGQGQDPHFFAHSFSNFPGPAKKAPASYIIENFNRVAEKVQGQVGQQITYNELPGIKTEKTRVAVLPVLEHAQVENDGKKVENPIAPFEVIFKPSPEIEVAYNRELDKPENKGADFRDLIRKVAKQGQTLFYVYGREPEAAKKAWVKKWGEYDSKSNVEQSSEGEDFNGEPIHSIYLGRVVLESDFIASEFGDQMRFIHSPKTVLIDEE